MRPRFELTLTLALASLSLSGALVVTSCGDDDANARAEEIVPEVPEPVNVEPHPADGNDVRLYKMSRPIMGTIFEITVAGETDDHAEPAVRAALDEIARLEGVLSEWRPETDISRINAAAGSEPVAVSEDAYAVVKAGLEVSDWSGGAFDLSWAALRGLYDFRPDHGKKPSTRELRARLRLIDYRDIVVDDAARTVFLRRRDMAIGTGGIGKGYALDRAAAVLERHGIESYMLFGGGQVQVHGLRGNRAWRVGIQHPRRNDYFAFLESTGGTISTSGDYEHFFIDEAGKRWHHILDPDTGLPVAHTLSVTMVAPDGMHGDALSTACFVLGAQKCLEMLARVPGNPEAVIVTSEMRVVTTPNVASRLHWNMEHEGGVLPP
jgi:thiamine biosynthesis lipoprotein